MAFLAPGRAVGRTGALSFWLGIGIGLSRNLRISCCIAASPGRATKATHFPKLQPAKPATFVHHPERVAE
jgi:hypothetical protein